MAAQAEGTHEDARISLVIPTRNEAGNVPELIRRLEAGADSVIDEVLFIDDSDDDTAEVIEAEARRTSLSVRLRHRAPHERHAGLSGAVLEGFRLSRNPWLAVMDADLQHPPELLPSLLRSADESGSDLASATRYAPGGDSRALGVRRGLLSRGSSSVADLLFPSQLSGVSDPMSGYFLVRRAALDLRALQPTGFKILLEVLVRFPALHRVEVPYTFADRLSGRTKVTPGVGYAYIRHLLHLRRSVRTNGGAQPSRPVGVDAVQELPVSERAADIATPITGRRPPRREVRPDRGEGWSYDVAGIITIKSEVALPELVWCLRDGVEGDPDIVIERGRVGSCRPLRQIHVDVAAGSVRYQEHLGALASNFSVDLSGPIRVTLGPLLSASPHVAYTNVVEALLRFALVARGYMLLHSATFQLGQTGVMLSAKTDTGKTGTILRLMREQQGAFLSDDMTILGPDGVARSYPKPLTISSHTLRAVDAAALGRAERVKLAVQSRVHSKGGRFFGAQLAGMNLPIMSVNALTQLVIPPPKYSINRLVPCTMAGQTRVSELFIIERGPLQVEAVDRVTALDELIENTDDAYGFPPFRSFAPAIAIAGDGYLTLREKERCILARALEGVRVRRLVTDDFSWADRIPALLDAPDRLAVAPVVAAG